MNTEAGIKEREQRVRDLFERDSDPTVYSNAATGEETKSAAEYWSLLDDYESYYTCETSRARSKFIADIVLRDLSITSLLEVGTNSGRNIAIVNQYHPNFRVRGIDVNPRAIEFAKSQNPHIDFEVVDCNVWREAPKSVDGILTMSVLDHIPEEAIFSVAQNMVATARKNLIVVEFWDGETGWRGPYKYSRNYAQLFARLGVTPLAWQLYPEQYDYVGSPLWLYIGRIDPA